MKVKLIHDNKETTGELYTRSDHVFYVSEDKKVFLIIERPDIFICGKDDDDCIWVRGLIKRDEKMFEAVNYIFYPLAR